MVVRSDFAPHIKAPLIAMLGATPLLTKLAAIALFGKPKAARIADAVLDGDIPDPTSGATQFLNETIVRQRRGGSLPRWAQGEGLVIGRHTFYSPDEAATGLGQASLALMFMQLTSSSC